jgi:uncharacterized membrane protein
MTTRLNSIDLLRGMVIVLMALDHVRHFFGPTVFNPVDLTQTSPELFLTRWITHFCAPVFVFLAGVSAFLYGNQGRSKSELSFFLVTRGIGLILLELTVVNLSWQAPFSFVQVIWALGWSMVILALLIRLPRWLIAIIALGMIIGHNFLDGMELNFTENWRQLWMVLHVPGKINLGGQQINIIYPLIPWIGVMAVGYLLGPLFLVDGKIRRYSFLTIGSGLVMIFLLLRYFNWYGDASLWTTPERGAIYTGLAFINTTKYPPSLLFLLMTLGPTLILLPLIENLSGNISQVFIRLGRVPLFFYLIHIPIIRLSAIAWFYYTGDEPNRYQPNLWLVYGVWISVILILYPLCYWFSEIKRHRKKWWLSYL